MQHLAICSYGHGGAQDKKALTYGDLASITQQSDALQFLTGTGPWPRGLRGSGPALRGV